jgi:hypothetical protein
VLRQVLQPDAGEVEPRALDHVKPDRPQVVDDAQFDTGVAVLVQQRPERRHVERPHRFGGHPVTVTEVFER